VEAPAPGTTPDPGATPTPVTARILVFGDSMTSGDEANPTGYRAYRGYLFQRLQAAGFAVDFIGSRKLVPAVGGDPDHDGYPGELIGPDPLGLDPVTLYDRLPAALEVSGEPDVVVMAFGWNSVNFRSQYAAQRYQGIVDLVRQRKPAAKLILATLPPQQGKTEAQTNALPGYQAFNAMARDLANASSGDNLYLADYAAAGFVASEYHDLIHWSAEGARRAAETIFQTLTQNHLLDESRLLVRASSAEASGGKGARKLVSDIR
jgi:lysophospholipase L1-like esterase